MESNLRGLPQGIPVFREERKPWGRKHLSTRRKRNQLRSRQVGATEHGRAQTESLPERAGRCGVRISICNLENAWPNLPGKADDKR